MLWSIGQTCKCHYLAPCTIFCNCFKSKFLKKGCPDELLITKDLHSMIFPQFAVNNSFCSQGGDCTSLSKSEMKLNCKFGHKTFCY